MSDEVWAYLSPVAEPPAPGVADLVARLGPFEAAERIRCGRVSERVAAETHGRHREWRAEADLAAAAAVGARLITPGHLEWPTRLFDACTAGRDPALAPPVALWVRGTARLAECCERAVAVVGSRAATSYGTHLAGDLSSGLARDGHSVVAAASQGIDATALKGVLAVAGTSIAVRPSGIDQPVPRPLAPLVEAVAATGLVVSEYPPGVPPSRTRLIARSRLLAALFQRRRGGRGRRSQQRAACRRHRGPPNAARSWPCPGRSPRACPPHAMTSSAMERTSSRPPRTSPDT